MQKQLEIHAPNFGDIESTSVHAGKVNLYNLPNRIYNMNNLKIVNDKMTTLDFAELTGTTHDNVLKKARKLLSDLEIDDVNFNAIYKDSMNRDKPMLALDRDLSLTLAGQYEPKIAYQVAKAFNAQKPLTAIEQAQRNLQLVIELEDMREAKELAERTMIIRLSKIGNHLAGSVIGKLGNNIMFNDVAKLISTNLNIELGHNSLMKLCRDNGWLMTGLRSKQEKNKPTQAKIKYFKMKLFYNEVTGECTITPVITPEGVVKLSELIPFWFTELGDIT